MILSSILRGSLAYSGIPSTTFYHFLILFPRVEIETVRTSFYSRSLAQYGIFAPCHPPASILFRRS